MREIKFRFFSKKNNQMRDWDYVKRYQMAALDDNLDGESYSPWMQYTGLKDENENEIYEGDILNVDNGRYSGIVKFNEHDLSFVIENKDGGFGFVNGQIFDERPEYRTYRIIGNIYENPELLTK